jgi:Ca2+-binding RTX toxin-like protein
MAPSRHAVLRLILVLACVVSTGLPAPARADERVIDDGDDSASPLDVEKVRQGHYYQYVLYRVTSFYDWNDKALAGGSMVFSFNTDADAAIERRAVLEYTGGGGSQLRLKVLNGKGERVAGGVHRRSSSRSVEVWIRRSALGTPETYRMSLKVTTTASLECVDTCTDRVPNKGTVFHRLHDLCSDQEPTIVGTDSDDTLSGTRGRDVIDGRAGDDKITDLHGTDVVCGGPGDDIIDGGRGFLVLRGGRGQDRIQAGGPRPRPCNDTGWGAASCAYPEAVLMGGRGADVLIGGRYHEYVLGEGGRDRLRGRRSADRLDGGAGTDELFGGRGSDYCRRGEELHACE